jgi:hypothetical protein
MDSFCCPDFEGGDFGGGNRSPTVLLCCSPEAVECQDAEGIVSLPAGGGGVKEQVDGDDSDGREEMRVYAILCLLVNKQRHVACAGADSTSCPCLSGNS